MTAGTAAAPRGDALVGVALSATSLCAATRRPGGGAPEARRFPLDPMNGANGGEWPSLEAALRDLARTRGDGDRLAIALMPPLVEVRRLDLPALRDEELRQLLTRSTARYFMGVRSPALVGTAAGARGAKHGVVAAAAGARLIAAIHLAARESGWTITSISPAEAAWAGAAAALWPAAERGRSAIVVAHDDRTDLVEVEHGRLAGVRHFRAGAADASLLADAIRAASSSNGTARVATLGPDAPRRELTRALSASAISLASPSAEWVTAAESADLLAAAFAGPDAVPLLVNEDTRAERVARAHRATRRAAAAAAVLLLVASVLELWGAKRELAAVQAQRAAIRPEIASTLVGRTTVETTFRRLAALGAADRSAPRWASIIAGVSDHLPEDAYLTAFRGRGDSVVVDGLAAHAARVFDMIEKTPGLTAARAAAPVRREAPAGSDAMEHFTIAARLAARTAATSVAPVKAGTAARPAP